MEPLHMQVPLVEMASNELEKMRRPLNDASNVKYHAFPPACLSLLKSINGNQRCADCGALDPQWATVSFGALLCLQCSGRHRGLGVQVSCVRSISMDEWSHAEVLSLLEGGNGQITEFFTRHKLCPKSHKGTKSNGAITESNVTLMRYKTKAAQFYREQLGLHVGKVMTSGEYKGRAHSRRIAHRKLTERNSFTL
eukprot:CAMPEP_0194039862 /NCGR_PEP_ID=MMETSP0009_2-20130614/11941_1 /TAXON_ID=210454 /ORGANISM="Grammatophora oceanica, Strain CCMP 410" /LENGTH=194 /DNA_ID=CAMNT_0038682817 /DNA_START=501 /DNA_END=1085 /DNA_ORIENTATION=-